MLVHWIWLATRQGLNKRTLYELVQHFGDPEALHRASEEDLRTFPGMNPKGLASLKDHSLETARKILNHCRQEQIHLLPLGDPGYPRRLMGIYDPPVLLYCRGVLPDWEAQPIIGAVGTRSCSEYGLRSGEQLGSQLTRCGGCVVSGIAQGVDAAILRGVLSAGGAPVVFLAGGVDVIYPTENRDLFHEILACGGCILSEQAPGTKPAKWLFPVRNRLISGISHGVLVVEAPEQSGALITARHAMEQGREVYVIPAPIDTVTGKGSNALMKAGAQMVQNGWDILEPYQDRYAGVRKRINEDPSKPQNGKMIPVQRGKTAQSSSKVKKVIDNGTKPPYIDVETKQVTRSPREQAIIAQLLAGPRLTDEVINNCGLSKGEALAVMTVLEIQGVVRRLPGNLMALNET